jgi:transposase InsO family protein
MRMIEFLSLVAHILVSPFKTRARLEAEIILLRHQVNVLRRRLPPKLKLTVADRLLFVWLYRLFPSVLAAITIVQPETIIRWHRTGFRLYWRWKSRSRGVTTNPTAEWIAHQITDAFPWKEAPDYLVRDRDGSYCHAVTRRLAAMGLRDHPTAPRSPWQNGHAERLIGSIRRECLHQIVVLGEAHLRRILAAYVDYYNELRTHLSPGQGFAGPTADPMARPSDRSAGPWRTSSSILSDVVFGRHTSADSSARENLNPLDAQPTREKP